LTQLYELPSPFENETGTILLHEPAWARAGELRAQLLDESYPKPFVVDDGQSRFLYFNVRLMQSEMSLKAPNRCRIRSAGGTDRRRTGRAGLSVGAGPGIEAWPELGARGMAEVRIRHQPDRPRCWGDDPGAF
jgi:hypothetical protein